MENILDLKNKHNQNAFDVIEYTKYSRETIYSKEVYEDSTSQFIFTLNLPKLKAKLVIRNFDKYEWQTYTGDEYDHYDRGRYVYEDNSSLKLIMGKYSYNFPYSHMSGVNLDYLEPIVCAVTTYAYLKQNINELLIDNLDNNLKDTTLEELETLNKKREQILNETYNLCKTCTSSMKMTKDDWQKFLDDKFGENKVNIEDIIKENLEEVLKQKEMKETARLEKEEKLRQRQERKEERQKIIKEKIDNAKDVVKEITKPVSLAKQKIKDFANKKAEIRQAKKEEKQLKKKNAERYDDLMNSFM